MKKLLSILLLLFAVATGYAQSIGQFKILRLINLTDSTSVTPINGSIYYNTQSNKFRAYQAGSWFDLIGGGGGGGNSWNLTGNTVGSIQKLGTLDNYDLRLIRNDETAALFSLSNTLLGRVAGNVVTGTNNTFVGQSAGFSTTTGSANTAIGSSAANNLSSGNSNIAIGYQSGNISIGSFNIAIGNATQVLSPSGTGQLAIQNIIYGLGNTATLSTVSTGTIGIGIRSPTARLHVRGTGTTTGVNFNTENQSGTSRFSVLDNGQVNFSGSAGTSGQVLTSAGIGAPPTWEIPGGITNTAANNEMAKSDGTNLVPSEIFSTIAGNLTLGSTATTNPRRIYADDNTGVSSLLLSTKGTGQFTFYQNNFSTPLVTIDNKTAGNGLINLWGSNVGITPAPISGGTGGELVILGGQSITGNQNGGNLILGGGQPAGTGVEGSTFVSYNNGSGLFNITGLVESILEAGTTLTLDDDLHRGKIIYFSSASGITVTVPSGLPQGFNVVLIQDGVGTITLSASGTTLNGKTATTGQYDAISLAFYKSSETYIGF